MRSGRSLEDVLRSLEDIDQRKKFRGVYMPRKFVVQWPQMALKTTTVRGIPFPFNKDGIAKVEDIGNNRLAVEELVRYKPSARLIEIEYEAVLPDVDNVATEEETVHIEATPDAVTDVVSAEVVDAEEDEEEEAEDSVPSMWSSINLEELDT